MKQFARCGATERARSGVRRLRSCPTARTRRASSGSTMCWRWRGRAASTSTRSACRTATRWRARRAGEVFLGVRLRDEDAGAGNRCALVFPADGAGAQGDLRRHFRRAVQSVFDRLLAVELAPRRPFPPDRRQHQRASGVPAARPSGLHRGDPAHARNRSRARSDRSIGRPSRPLARSDPAVCRLAAVRFSRLAPVLWMRHAACRALCVDEREPVSRVGRRDDLQRGRDSSVISVRHDRFILPACSCRCAPDALASTCPARVARSLAWLVSRRPELPSNTRRILLARSIPTALSVVIEWSGLWYPSNLGRALCALPLGAAAAWIFVQSLRAKREYRLAIASTGRDPFTASGCDMMSGRYDDEIDCCRTSARCRGTGHARAVVPGGMAGSGRRASLDGPASEGPRVPARAARDVRDRSAPARSCLSVRVLRAARRARRGRRICSPARRGCSRACSTAAPAP